MKSPITSSQTIAIVAISIAVAAGAYALGRSHNGEAEAPSTQAVMTTSAPAIAPAPLPAPVVVAAAEPVQAKPELIETVAPAPAAPSLCGGCSRVLGVHTEQRQVQSTSGVGAVGGAVLGGLLGNRFGGGTGRKLATVGGAVAGGYAGNEIEKNRNTRRVWVIELKDGNGHVHRREQSSDPALEQGDVVSVRDGRLVRR